MTDVARANPSETDSVIWIGRYQPFHIGHTRIVDRGLQTHRCTHFIGIVCYEQNADVIPVEERHRATADLFTPRERLTMARLGLSEVAGSEAVEIAYVPYLEPDRWQRIEAYIPANPIFFVTNKDDGDLDRLDAFESLGRRYNVLDVSDLDIPSSTSIRHAIRSGDDWKQFFAPATHDYFDSILGPSRLSA